MDTDCQRRQASAGKQTDKETGARQGGEKKKHIPWIRKVKRHIDTHPGRRESNTRARTAEGKHRRTPTRTTPSGCRRSRSCSTLTSPTAIYVHLQKADQRSARPTQAFLNTTPHEGSRTSRPTASTATAKKPGDNWYHPLRPSPMHTPPFPRGWVSGRQTLRTGTRGEEQKQYKEPHKIGYTRRLVTTIGYRGVFGQS